MNPVIGLDVSKGESQIHAFLDKGKPYRMSIIPAVPLMQPIEGWPEEIICSVRGV